MASKTAGISLYDSTFTLHRLSPLYCPESSTFLADASLQIHARRFGGSLKGDVLRGIRVERNMADEAAKAGPFKQCRWSMVGGREEQLAEGLGESQDNAWNAAAQDVRGIQVEMEYEKTTYVALMLQNGDSRPDPPNAKIYLPLLLTRMPTSLREILLDYLATTFDTRAEVMRLSNGFISGALDNYLQTISNSGSWHLQKVVKDVHLTLGFKAPIAPSLRSLDITIKREDVLQFLKRGERSRKSRDPGSQDRRKRKRDDKMEANGPFIIALSDYIREHLAVDISHEAVFLSKVSCGAFVLGREGKARIQSPMALIESADQDEGDASSMPEAMTGLLKSLLLEAEGNFAALVNTT